MKAKERHKLKLLEYLGNPENDFVNRVTQATVVLGFANVTQLYNTFTPDELSEIEAEALAIRRKKYSPHIASIDRAMIREANNGNDRAAKLCYQRFEDWGERKEMSGPGGKPVQFVFVEENEGESDES